MSHFLKKQIYIHNIFKTYVKKPNQPQFLISDIKTGLKIMSMEQGLY